MKPGYGKLSPRSLRKTVFRSLGAPSQKVVVGPGVGLDNAMVDVGEGRVLIVTTDPVSLVSEIGEEDSAWLSVHLIASDFATSGNAPQFATFAYNFPRKTPEGVAASYLSAIGRECRALGVSIVGGHTGSYPGAGLPVVGAGTMLGTARRYVTPAMARPGDAIVMTKSAAIEAAVYLAFSFPDKVGARTASKAKRMLRQCTTVRDAEAVASVGLGASGVTSMHDATEGGVLGGLREMAEASGKAFVVDESSVRVSDTAKAVCDQFGLDPLRTLSEGALLVTCAQERADDVVAAVKRSGSEAGRIGSVEEGKGLYSMMRGTKERIPLGEPDRYWSIFERGGFK